MEGVSEGVMRMRLLLVGADAFELSAARQEFVMQDLRASSRFARCGCAFEDLQLSRHDSRTVCVREGERLLHVRVGGALARGGHGMSRGVYELVLQHGRRQGR
ncbi:uncharacterized protein EMH_0096060 [Eimeria mitis]|uniref:Uncharacterized protein n=1 Tax=Eimeria mitis TaxID=44415 RepID=U6KB90_9EIME|nr:uncharacterized protein EMH_0096060 [Eimeria mitis]CDJ35219.1 hypothetical protein EMH_0096060 [Eimeria mitis]